MTKINSCLQVVKHNALGPPKRCHLCLVCFLFATVIVFQWDLAKSFLICKNTGLLCLSKQSSTKGKKEPLSRMSYMILNLELFISKRDKGLKICVIARLENRYSVINGFIEA